MSALYVIRYSGDVGLGAAVLFIGKGTILGVDLGENTYRGTYTESNGKMEAQVSLTAGNAGASLVTGQVLSPGQTMVIAASLPIEPEGGPHRVWVGAGPVNLTFQKIGSVP